MPNSRADISLDGDHVSHPLILWGIDCCLTLSSIHDLDLLVVELYARKAELGRRSIVLISEFIQVEKIWDASVWMKDGDRCFSHDPLQ